MNLHSPIVVAVTLVALAALYFFVRRAGKKKLEAEDAQARQAAVQAASDALLTVPSKEYCEADLPDLASSHPDMLVRRLAQALIVKKKLPPRIRTIHYVRLRQFVAAVSPSTLDAYDKLHKAPNGQKEREEILAAKC